jgi:hypothetical protein
MDFEEVLCNIAVSLNLNRNVSVKSCQLFLDQSAATFQDVNDSNDFFAGIFSECRFSIDKINEAYSSLTNSSFSLDDSGGNTSSLIKIICAALLYKVQAAADNNRKIFIDEIQIHTLTLKFFPLVSISCSKLLFCLCSMPGAAAYGVSNSNVMTSMLSQINKIIVHGIQCNPALKTKSKAKSKT